MCLDSDEYLRFWGRELRIVQQEKTLLTKGCTLPRKCMRTPREPPCAPCIFSDPCWLAHWSAPQGVEFDLGPFPSKKRPRLRARLRVFFCDWAVSNRFASGLELPKQKQRSMLRCPGVTMKLCICLLDPSWYLFMSNRSTYNAPTHLRLHMGGSIWGYRSRVVFMLLWSDSPSERLASPDPDDSTRRSHGVEPHGVAKRDELGGL